MIDLSCRCRGTGRGSPCPQAATGEDMLCDRCRWVFGLTCEDEEMSEEQVEAGRRMTPDERHRLVQWRPSGEAHWRPMSGGEIEGLRG